MSRSMAFMNGKGLLIRTSAEPNVMCEYTIEKNVLSSWFHVVCRELSNSDAHEHRDTFLWGERLRET